jgi:hypothetical protein
VETIEVLGDLNSRIAFQKKWRQITSFSYFTGATLSVIAAATATVVAGLGYAAAAAVVAAIATIATSLEKVLLFREKWARAGEAHGARGVRRPGHLPGVRTFRP